MSVKEKFTGEIKSAYLFSGDYITLGGAIYKGECINNLYACCAIIKGNRKIKRKIC